MKVFCSSFPFSNPILFYFSLLQIIFDYWLYNFMGSFYFWLPLAPFFFFFFLVLNLLLGHVVGATDGERALDIHHYFFFYFYSLHPCVIMSFWDVADLEAAFLLSLLPLQNYQFTLRVATCQHTILRECMMAEASNVHNIINDS
ncbi:hypothetical protein F5883DRAFT_614773, partial [Diaporthe sp. PMI_573]